MNFDFDQKKTKFFYYFDVKCLRRMNVFFEYFFEMNENLKFDIEYFEFFVNRMNELQKKIFDFDAKQIYLLQKFFDSISQISKQN